ncbi:MAG: SUMF1/EgtB/PvdO family nonheme iron enzyme, partial [Myxococcota bacterium]
RGEPLGAYVARWRARSAPPVRSEEAIDPELVSLIEDSLASAPDQRPSAEAFAAVLDIILSGASERSRREGDAAHCLARARELMGRHRELGLRIQDEQRVVAVLENKIPAHAPLAAKRSLWDAQQRVRQLDGQRMIVWLDAVHEATIAQGLLEDDEAARELRAELWATRLEDQSRRGVQREVFIAQRQVRHVDPDKRGRAINAPAIVDLSGPEDAQVTFFRFVARARQLVPEQVALPPLPWRRQRLEAGRYLVTVEAPGCVPLRYPLSVDPGERFHGELRPRSAQDVGEGFVFVPAGPFRLGGDLEAINPLDRCRPTLPDLFIRRDPVSNAEWKRFLDDLAVEDARAHVPGVSGLGEHWWPAWAHHEDTGWTPGPSWRMDGPVVGIPMASAEAYARWASQRTGRPLRLPTEEEWEKAARGVDGRAYPWGDDADPVFACIRHSRAGSPGGPAPIGAFPVDVSVYGCRDMAGNVREWTTSWQGEGEVVVRGGSWQDEMGAMRCAHRAGQLAHRHELTTGFRLVSEAPASTR